MSYTQPLPQNVSLQVFNRDSLIFESSGKWLHPLFELEEFLKTYDGERDMLCSHDCAVGKAAAVLTIRLGIKKINADLLSENALRYINLHNAHAAESDRVGVEYSHLVPKLMCVTENQLEELDDDDYMYFLLRQRAKLVQGVDVSVQDLVHPFVCKKNLSFELKAGTLYPILHGLEEKGMVRSYDKEFAGKTRKYYSITSSGMAQLEERTKEWKEYSDAVRGVLALEVSVL